MSGLHNPEALVHNGRALAEAEVAMILLHGRGADAQSILSLAAAFNQSAYGYLAPQASGNSWYPHSFIAPLEQNEPYLSSALGAVAAAFAEMRRCGIPPQRVILGGFSQGACLALEYAARHPQRYGGVFAFSGGLIGPLGMPFDYDGSLEGTPVFLGCSDNDAHIPLKRVHTSEEVLKGMGAEVRKEIYPDMGHTVNQDEIEVVSDMMRQVIVSSAG